MTKRDFWAWCEAVYGRWRRPEPGSPFSEAQDVRDYLETCSDRYLDLLREELLLGYETRYGPPCVANLVKFEDRIGLRMQREAKPVMQIEDKTEYVTPEQLEAFWAQFGKRSFKNGR